jgi:hypothetical protein
VIASPDETAAIVSALELIAQRRRRTTFTPPSLRFGRDGADGSWTDAARAEAVADGMPASRRQG